MLKLLKKIEVEKNRFNYKFMNNNILYKSTISK